MYSLITKISHSVPIKDAIGVGRGLFRIISTMTPTSQISIDLKQYSRNNHLNNRQQNILTIKYPSQNIIGTSSKIQQTQISQKKQRQSTQQIDIKRYDEVNISEVNKEEDMRIKIKQEIKNIKFQQSNQLKQVRESKVVSSRVGRFFQYIKLGKSIVEMEVEAIVARNFGGSKQEDIYERGANLITQQLCKMRGAPLKLAQILSIQQDNLIPTPIRKAFEKARQNAHIMPESQVEQSIKLYLGTEWKSKFTFFDKKPFASASIGQVHHATALDGKQLAIKLQYPGVQKSIQSDINNIKMLLKLPGVLPKGIFLDKLLANTQKQLKQQCNYQRQSKMQELYSKCLNKVMKTQAQRFKIPQIYHQISNRNILSSQLLKGVKLNHFQNEKIPQIVRDEIGRLLMKLTFTQIFSMGIMQSDPNPSNFTYNTQTLQLNLFDFGATHIYSQDFLNNYCEIINASVQQNRQKIIEKSISTGFLTNEENSIMIEKHVESILLIGEPLRYNGIYDFGNQKITERIYKTIPQMLKNRLKSPPEQIYSLHRKLSGAYLACIRMNSKVDCHKIYKELQQGYTISQFC